MSRPWEVSRKMLQVNAADAMNETMETITIKFRDLRRIWHQVKKKRTHRELLYSRDCRAETKSMCTRPWGMPSIATGAKHAFMAKGERTCI